MPGTGALRCSAFLRSAVALFLVVPSLASAHGERAMPPRQLTDVQFDTFVEQTGDSEANVSRRLVMDPGLIPLAAVAADARRSRRRVGTSLMAWGFTIVGLASTITLIGAAGVPDTDPPCSGGRSCRGLEIFFGVSSAVGLALAIPGIVVMARESSVEKAAGDRYRSATIPLGMPDDDRHPSPHRPTTAFSLTLLSMTFE